jgi:hypothetical protein
MSPILEATKANAKDAALVAFGLPVVLIDRVSSRLNTRLHLDSYLELAREHAERALDGCRDKGVHLIGGVAKQIIPAWAKPPRVTEAPTAVAPASTSATAPKKRAPRAKSSR